MSGNLIVIKHSDLQDTKPNFEINIIFYGPTKFRIRIYWMDLHCKQIDLKIQVQDLFPLTFILLPLKLNSGLHFSIKHYNKKAIQDMTQY